MRYLPTLLFFIGLALDLSTASNFDIHEPIKQGIGWKPCQNNATGGLQLECGHFEIPLDWHDPSVGKGQLAVSRYKATKKPKGVLFVHVGMLPDTGIGWLEVRGEALAEHLVKNEYDIVTWDLRGMPRTAMNVSGMDWFHTIPSSASCFNTSREEGAFWWKPKQAHIPWNNSPSITERGDMELYFKWYKKFEDYMHHCLSMQQAIHPDTPYLRYMGTPATVRDLVALADCLQGPGTPINFMGVSHGSLIGSYLINMFPERVGRIILDGPVDPREYASEPSHLVWERDVTSAHEVLTAFQERCANNDCRLVSNKWVGEDVREYTQNLLAIVRVLFAGWKTTLPLDYRDQRLQDFATNISNGTGGSPLDLYNWTSGLHKRQREIDNSRASIGSLIASFCGDHDDYELDFATEETIVRRIKKVSESVPLLGRTFPGGYYLCHLWPIRAVERYNGSWDRVPANPVLIVANTLDPLNGIRGARAVADRMGEHAVLIEQDGFGYSFYPHHPRATKMMSRYMMDGVLPTEGERLCRGDETAPSEVTSLRPPTILLLSFILALLALIFRWVFRRRRDARLPIHTTTQSKARQDGKHPD